MNGFGIIARSDRSTTTADVSNANGNVTQDASSQRFGYDQENHQTAFFVSSNSGSTPDATYSYDGDGKRVKKISSTATTVTDQAGKLRRSVTNGLGQLARVDEPDGTSPTGALGAVNAPNQHTDYVYDVLNNLNTVTQGSQTRTFSYDALSRLTQAVNPESGTINYTYDANSNLATKTDARSIVATYTYDRLNRVTLRAYTNEPSGSDTPDVTYYYDNVTNAKGKLTKVTSSVSTTEYTAFDILGHVTAHKQTTDGGDSTGYSTGYTYTLGGALDEESYPSTRVVKNVLDQNGDLSIVEAKKNSSSGYWHYADNPTYNAAGALTSLQLGNGRWESTVFNSRLQPTEIKLGTVQGGYDQLRLQFSYGDWVSGSVDSTKNNGNIVQQVITVPTVGSNTGFTATQKYYYDSLNRIDDSTETISSTQTWRQDFTYDRYGNRNFNETNTTMPASFSNPAVTDPTISTTTNRITSSGYSYDSSGNTTAVANGQSYVYDGENRQVEAKNSGNYTIGRYYYDGDGKRVKKIAYDSTGNETETTIFVYDSAGKEIAEYSDVVANSTDAKVNYLTNDHLGSPRINTDANGMVISRHDYHPFGEEIATSQRTTGLNYGDDTVRKQFTGYERDDETDLDFAQARMYANRLGRFTTTDPSFFQFMMLVDPQRFDLYGYARNNPLKWIDPNGEKLYLRGANNWLRNNILYEMAGGQEEFDKYFEIKDGQVVARDGVDISKANAGVQELAGLVNATENYVYFAGTDGGAVADLFQGTRDNKGKLNDTGKAISNRFTCGGNYISGCGAQVGTTGRPYSEQPAKLANGDPVFAVIAYNVNTVQTETKTDYGTLNPVPADVKAAQEAGVGQIVRPVGLFIHESTENRKFAEQGSGKMDYGSAHAHAIQREAVIRKALNISGGFAGAYLDTRIPRK